jgi:hypothetical protein
MDTLAFLYLRGGVWGGCDPHIYPVQMYAHVTGFGENWKVKAPLNEDFRHIL